MAGDPSVSEGDNDDSSSASSASSAGTIKPLQSLSLWPSPTLSVLTAFSFSRCPPARTRGADFPTASSPSRKTTLDQLPWTSFFGEDRFFVGLSPEEGILHHMYITPPGPKGPTFVAHHGAGSSGLSFAVLAAEIRKLMPDAGFLSLDARSHGETMTATVGSPGLDLSLDSLTNDMIYAIRVYFEHIGWSSQPRSRSDQGLSQPAPKAGCNLIFIGHSLGGAVMTNVAKSGVFGDQVLGYAVLDVVEGSSSRHAEIIFYSQLTDRIGSAIDALQSMQTYLSTRPPGFESVSAGIEWHVQSRTIRNPTSASVSVPGLLRENHASHLPSDAWTWSTDLLATQPYWENWFVGLSKNFLEARGGKLLILAGTDRLDKELIIGQMQGKYQLLVFPETGHFIHEDAPAKTAQALVDFYKRNDRSALVLPPKVSELLKQKAMQEKS